MAQESMIDDNVYNIPHSFTSSQKFWNCLDLCYSSQEGNDERRNTSSPNDFLRI